MDNWRELIKQKRFAEAESLVEAEYNAHAHLGNEVENSGFFYEEWGDYTEDKAAKQALYQKADHYFSMFASWSTSGGEGTARMRSVNRVREKLAALNQINC